MNFKFEEPIYVTRPLLPSMGDYVSLLEKIWCNKYITNNGPLEQQLQLKLKNFLNAKNIELFSNGHTALEIAIKSLNLKGNVITTPFTFASTTQAIINNGLNPVFADVEKEYYNIDPENIEELITEETQAIIPVHVFGNPCDVKKINKIAKKHDLKVIYDAAHAFGVSVDNTDIGNFGDISMFSFHATKVFNTIEGGSLVYSDNDLTFKFKALKNFGITPDLEEVQFLGQNGKMNEFEAAMGLLNLDNVDSAIIQRKLIYEKYLECLEKLEDNNLIKLLRPEMNVNYNYSYFTVKFNSLEEKNFIFNKLQEYNVFTKKYFYPPCNEFPAYNFKNNTPIAHNISETILSLPLYADLSLDDVEKICKIIEFELNNF